MKKYRTRQFQPNRSIPEPAGKKRDREVVKLRRQLKRVESLYSDEEVKVIRDIWGGEADSFWSTQETDLPMVSAFEMLSNTRIEQVILFGGHPFAVLLKPIEDMPLYLADKGSYDYRIAMYRLGALGR